MQNTRKMPLTDFLSATNLFQKVDKAVLSLLAEQFTPVTVPADTVLIQAGSSSDSLYLLQTGKLAVLLKDKDDTEVVVSILHPGESIGEIALLTGAIRSATVRTVEPSNLWQLTRPEFESVAIANPPLYSVIEQAIMGRIRRANLSAAIYENSLFEELDRSVLPDLEQALEPVVLKGGEILLHEGEPSDALYIIINGRVRVETVGDDGDKTILKELGRGKVVGEMGVISGEPRGATIYALRNTLLGRLDGDRFYRLLQKHPQALTRLFSATIISDLRNKTSGVAQKQIASATVAVIALGADVPLTTFAEQLTLALNTHGSAAHINDTITDEALGQADISQASMASAADGRLSLWFAEQEAKYNYLIYSSKQDATQPNIPLSWTARCLGQADHIFYVAWANGEPQPIQISQKSKTRRTLILLHPSHCQIPVGTQRWLDALQPNGHYHVRWPGPNDVGRLARLLTGRGIGLVLSGGGARGFAHIGVIRALQEANCPVDLVGGTSIGAIVGGLLALGHNADSMKRELVRYMGNLKQILDVTIPIASLFAGKKFELLTRRLYGQVQIEDAWRDFFCVTTDITRAAETIHTRGPLWKYIRASSSLPIAFPPQVDGDNLLIDGCFMNNYPANIMYNRYGCGKVIGVNTCLEGDLSRKNQYGNSLSGWDILNGKVNPFAKPINAPGLFETLNRLSDLSTAERSQQQRQLTDLFIRPPIQAYNAQDFHKYEEIIDAGYQAAQPLIANWLAFGEIS